MEKYERLKEVIRNYKSVAVAFSGGVDSTFLLRAAKDALGVENVIAVTARSASFPERELKEAESFAASEGIRLFTVESEELSIPGFADNPKNRCYLCKKELFTEIRELADREGMLEVAEGSNLDDEGDYRPGLQAVKELGVRSPLREAGLGKADIRSISKELGLPTWNKQSFACLASRFVYGERITAQKLKMIEKAEQLLLDMGFYQVRVRLHGEGFARIEVPRDQLEMIFENKDEIARRLREYGFTYITVDLEGFRSGSMNEVLE